jgi:hypothetical protein
MVTFPWPLAGMVICYDYIWLHEHTRGWEQGSKDRPCVVVLTLPGKRIIALPITHRKPDDPLDGMQMPPAVKARLGLDPEPSWVILTEANTFEWPGPDLCPVNPRDANSPVYGVLPEIMIREIRNRVVARARNRTIRVIERTPANQPA